jgi:hypothetical protein
MSEPETELVFFDYLGPKMKPSRPRGRSPLTIVQITRRIILCTD